MQLSRAAVAQAGFSLVPRTSRGWLKTSQESVMGRKLYVGNLPYETNEQDLQELFAQAGNVETVTVMRDRDTGRARGFAFVEMSSDDEAQNAITKLNDQQFGGRRLTVNEARPQVPRSGGGGGGGGLTAVVVLHVAANLAGRQRSFDSGRPGRSRKIECRASEVRPVRWSVDAGGGRARLCDWRSGHSTAIWQWHGSARRRTPHRHRLR